VHDDQSKWVLAAKKGDRAAFDRLIELYQRQAVAVAARLLNNMDDALEATQDAFVRAFQALDQLQEPGRFKAWLMRIVTNQALNYRRSRSRHRHVSLSDSYGSDEGEGADSLDRQLPGLELSALEMLSADELKGQIHEAIEALPENLKTALLLFCVEKLPQKEIADIMECSVQSVKWNVFEARNRLRKHLKDML